MITTKTLRNWCKAGNEETITDAQLQEIFDKYCFEQDSNQEYAGNFILTKCEETYTKHINLLCCGIITKTFYVTNDMIHYAMDYGH